ncbi:beta-ketoacyl-[acyl-carrier-protein] synthase family protein [Rhodoferax sp.]|uniref:beta-ketoacyl-[acyl-carrier-protein] synthase family protein n=1 Tax=Rhodoferax sp. TaxID=50421 RepID=UPI0025F8BF7A|nr:beta-ketoacyl-[acyl-carrier-protein] synthase family protein [Rhodoferax sp.]
MKRRVAITGLGLVSSRGQSPAAAFEAWCNGVSDIALHDIGEAPYATAVPFALCVDFDPTAVLGRSRLATMERVSQLSAVAAISAWHDAQLEGLDTAQRDSACVLWGTGGGGTNTTERSYHDLFVKQRPRISPLSVVLGMHNAAASHIALQLGLGGDCLTYSVACASSAVAVGEAFRRVQSGQADIAVAGGAEAAMPFGIVKAWESMKIMAPAGTRPEASCRPFHAGRQGLVLGEGSAALILEDWEHAHRRSARIYAEIAGYGSSCDHMHLTTPDAQGQLRALRQALRDASVNPEDVQYVNAHGTATLDGDPVEIAALRTLLGAHAPNTLVSATKSMHGHLLGAAGAIEIMATALALQTQNVPPTAHLDQIDPACAGLDHVCGTGRAGVKLQVALSNSFAFGGSNAVLVLKAA